MSKSKENRPPTIATEQIGNKTSLAKVLHVVRSSSDAKATSDGVKSTQATPKKKKRWVSLPNMYKFRGKKGLVLGMTKAGSAAQSTVDPPEPPVELLSRLRWNNRPFDVHMAALSPRSDGGFYDTSDDESHDYTGSPRLDEATRGQKWAPGPYSLYFRCRTTDAVAVHAKSSIMDGRCTSCPALLESTAVDMHRDTGIASPPSEKDMKPIRTSNTWPGMCSRPSSTLSLPTLASEQGRPNAVPDLYDPITHECVLPFSSMRPRSVSLKRRHNKKREVKALWIWRDTVLRRLNSSSSSRSTSTPWSSLPRSKRERLALSRQFIYRELYTTEVTFWSQLLYSKVMFHDPMHLALERSSPFVRSTDIDWFSNLDDLMQFSARLIRALRSAQIQRCTAQPTAQETASLPLEPPVGRMLRSLVGEMVVFLRCALDYKTNRKQQDIAQTNKGYSLYTEKLESKRETRQFTLCDYLIIPIQRATRYELLLSDLLKHTEPSHPDYHNIALVHNIATGLATAMNYAQRK